MRLKTVCGISSCLAAKAAPRSFARRSRTLTRTGAGLLRKRSSLRRYTTSRWPSPPRNSTRSFARYDSTGTGQISKADFVARLLPADYPTAANRAGQKINGKIAAFFQALTSALAELEEGGSVSRSAAIEAAKRAAKDSSLALPASAAHHAGGRRVRERPARGRLRTPRA